MSAKEPSESHARETPPAKVATDREAATPAPEEDRLPLSQWLAHSSPALGYPPEVLTASIQHARITDFEHSMTRDAVQKMIQDYLDSPATVEEGG